MRKVLLALGLAACSHALYAISLEPEAAAAFQRYVALTEQRIEAEVAGPKTFLWLDTVRPDRVAGLQQGLRSGGVIIERLKTTDGAKNIEANGALIHHWVATVFVPGVAVNEAVALMQDYDRHAVYFAPAIAASNTMERRGDRFKVALRFHVKKVITVTMDTENDAEFFRLGSDRTHSRIRSTRVTEIADAGTANEKPKPAGEEHGFMWNLNTYWRFLERDGGTYIQCESLTLSRDVPFALAWIIRPIVTQMPRESLTFTMAKARQALVDRQKRTP